MNRYRIALTGLGFVALLAGCSTPEQFKGVAIGETPTLITSLPPLLQTGHVSCGPTCVAAVAAYWDKDYSPLFSNESPYLAENTSATDLTNLVQALGLKSFVYSGSINDLEDNLRNGRPIIVLIGQPQYAHKPEVKFNGISPQALWHMVMPKSSHWVVAIGFTDSKIIIQDPAHGRMAISRSKFDSWWEPKKRTCLLVAP